MQTDTLQFLHRSPGLITGGVEVADGIYWGGDFTEVVHLLKENKLQQVNIRFYVGYSGWGEGQLDSEMEQKTWLVTEGSKKLVFHRDTN